MRAIFCYIAVLFGCLSPLQAVGQGRLTLETIPSPHLLVAIERAGVPIGVYPNRGRNLYSSLNSWVELNVWAPDDLPQAQLRIENISQPGFVCIAARNAYGFLVDVPKGKLFHMEKTGTYANLPEVAFSRWERNSCTFIEQGFLKPLDFEAKARPAEGNDKLDYAILVVAYYPVTLLLNESQQNESSGKDPLVVGKDIGNPSEEPSSVIFVFPHARVHDIEDPIAPRAVIFPE